MEATGAPLGLVAARLTVTGLVLLSPLPLGVGEMELTVTVGGEVAWFRVTVPVARPTPVAVQNAQACPLRLSTPAVASAISQGRSLMWFTWVLEVEMRA